MTGRYKLLCALVALLMLCVAVPAFATGNDQFPRVGSFAFKFGAEVPQPEGIDAGLRLLLAPYEHGMFLVDVDSLKPLANVPFPFTPAHRLSVDDVHHRVFVPIDHENVQIQIPKDVAGVQRVTKIPLPPSFAVVDLASRAVAGTYTFPPQFAGMSIDATGYYAPLDLLYVITDVIELRPETPTHRLTVHELDAGKLLSDPAHAVRWSYDFDACNNVADGGGRYGFVNRSGRAPFVYFPCDTGYQGPSNGIVRLDIVPGATPSDTSKFSAEFEFFGGGLGDGFVVGDPSNDRVAVFAGGAGHQKLYVFDVYNRSWTGSVPLPEGTIGGGVFDPGSGRLYATVVGGGANITEGSWIPTPQGAEFPTDSTVAIGNPVFDPRKRTLFLTAFRLVDDINVQDKVIVYQDRIPPAQRTALEDPDARTQNVAEVAGVTQTAFSGGGSAYGARYLFTGGTQVKGQGQIFSVEKVVSDQFAGATTAAGQGRNLPFAPGGSGRQVYFGRVTDLFVDSGTASAKSISSDPDSVTRADIAQIHDNFASSDTVQPADNDNEYELALKQAINGGVDAFKDAARPVADQTVTWPYLEANCADFGNDGDKARDGQKGAHVSCDHSIPAAQADATSLSELAGLSVHVAYASSSVEAHRDPKLGMTVKATSLARGVDVGGILSIGEVSTVATVRSFGRPGSARATFERTLHEVVVRDSSGDVVLRCGFGDTSCDPLTVAAATNKEYPTHLRVDFPQPERNPAIAETPGGAQALVTKSLFQYWSDFNSNGESSYEVPGMQVMVYDDAYPQILQLAGVAADAHYTVTAGGQSGNGGAAQGGGVQTIYVTNQVPYAPPPATQVLGTKQGPLYATLQRAASGVGFALARPREGMLLAAVWLLAGAPVYLAWRRRSLAALKEDRS